MKRTTLFLALIALSLSVFSQQDTAKAVKNGISLTAGVNYRVKYKQGTDFNSKYYVTPGIMLNWRHRIFAKSNVSGFAGMGIWHETVKYDDIVLYQKVSTIYWELPISLQYQKKRFVLEGGVSLRSALFVNKTTTYHGCWTSSDGTEVCERTPECSEFIPPFRNFSQNTSFVLSLRAGYIFKLNQGTLLQITPELKWKTETLYNLTNKPAYIIESSKYIYLFSGLKIVWLW